MAISFIQCTNLHKQWLNYFYLFLMINSSIFIQNYVNINNEILNDSCRLGRQISLQNKRCLWNTYVKIQVAYFCQILLDPAQIQTWLWSIIIKINLYAKYYISLSNICENLSWSCWWSERLANIQTAAKQYGFPSSKGRIK